MENNDNSIRQKVKEKIVVITIIGLLFTFSLAILFFNLLSPLFTLFLFTFLTASYLLIVASMDYINENYISKIDIYYEIKLFIINSLKIAYDYIDKYIF